MSIWHLRVDEQRPNDSVRHFVIPIVLLLVKDKNSRYDCDLTIVHDLNEVIAFVLEWPHYQQVGKAMEVDGGVDN